MDFGSIQRTGVANSCSRLVAIWLAMGRRRFPYSTGDQHRQAGTTVQQRAGTHAIQCDLADAAVLLDAAIAAVAAISAEDDDGCGAVAVRDGR